MFKYLKRLLFWLFILFLVVVMGFLGVKAYIQANSERAINYIVDKYEIDKKDIIALRYQEYVYSDIANCDSLWIKKCSDDKTLLYSYVLKTKDGKEIKIKEYKNKVFEDNFKEGKIRESYKEKLEINKNEEN